MLLYLLYEFYLRVFYSAGSHANYNDWIDDALGKLNSVPEGELFDKVTSLRVFLKDQIQVAFQNNKSLHDYFESLPKLDVTSL